MPFFYDAQRTTTTNGSANTESTHLAAKAAASQPTLGIFGIMATARSLTAGGGSVRTKTNSNGGTVYSGGTSQTPAKKNTAAPAAQSTWVNDGSAITPGTTLVIRGAVGFAQTGGTGGMQPIMQQAAYQLQCTSASGSPPVDIEFLSISATASIAIDITIELGEDI